MNTEQRKKNKKTQKELYLKVPYHILNIPKLKPSEKMLLAHIYSFGSKGCWQSNETLAEMFMTSKSNISRKLKKIRSYIYVKSPKGYYRTIWAKSHPDVRKSRPYLPASTAKRGESEANPCKNAQLPVQNVSPDLRKSAIRLTQKCATTNNNTIKENNKDITATPSPPLPKGAPALLVQRKKDAKVQLEQFKQMFGLKKKKVQPMSEEQFQRRKQAQMKALLG